MANLGSTTMELSALQAIAKTVTNPANLMEAYIKQGEMLGLTPGDPSNGKFRNNT